MDYTTYGRMHACMHAYVLRTMCHILIKWIIFIFIHPQIGPQHFKSFMCFDKIPVRPCFFSGLFQWNYCASKYCVWISLQPNGSLRIFSKRINHISYVLWPYSSLLILGMIRNYNQNERDRKNRLSFELESLNHMRECLCFRRNSFFPIFTIKIEIDQSNQVNSSILAGCCCNRIVRFSNSSEFWRNKDVSTVWQMRWSVEVRLRAIYNQQ